VFALIVLIGGGCSSSAKKASAPAPAAKASDKTVTLVAGDTDVETYGAPVKIPAATQKAILAASQRFVDTAITAPLASGALGSGYDTLFDGGVRAAATGADAQTLTDLGMGKVDHFDESSNKVAFSALADGNGSFLYLASRFRLDINAKTGEGPAHLVHDVELTFAPAGSSWSVTAYRVWTWRNLPGGTTSTTAKAGGTP
jgi:hypothetical protein